MPRDLTDMFYEPEPTGEYNAEMLARELRRISNAFRLIADGYRPVLHVEPVRPEDGMIVFADGTDWDPGSGEGVYERASGAWNKL